MTARRKIYAPPEVCHPLEFSLAFRDVAAAAPISRSAIG